jgi:hypothetical protein
MVRNKTVLLKLPVLKLNEQLSSALELQNRIRECIHENVTCWCIGSHTGSSGDYLTGPSPCCSVVATRVPVMSHLTGENSLQYKLIHVHYAKKSTRVLVSPFVQFCSRSMTRMTFWRSMWRTWWRSSCWLNTEQAEPFTNRLQSKILLPMGEYRYWVLEYSIINGLCRHDYCHRNLGHGRFRPEVLRCRHRYFYIMGVIGCVHKLSSRMVYTAELGEILFITLRSQPEPENRSQLYI